MEGGIPLECVWSQALLELPGASAPVRGFGASDCHSGCEAHLVFFVQPQDLLKPFMQVARRQRDQRNCFPLPSRQLLKATYSEPCFLSSVFSPSGWFQTLKNSWKKGSANSRQYTAFPCSDLSFGSDSQSRGCFSTGSNHQFSPVNGGLT